jgi:hypothetical protein
MVALADDGTQSNNLYTAVLGETVFIVRGQNVFTVGSLGGPIKLHLLEHVATGMWADETALWIATAPQTYLSNDAGWTWIVQPGKVAVGPGLYTTSGANLEVSSTVPFVEDHFPIRLTDKGSWSIQRHNGKHGSNSSGRTMPLWKWGEELQPQCPPMGCSCSPKRTMSSHCT